MSEAPAKIRKIGYRRLGRQGAGRGPETHGKPEAENGDCSN